MYGRFTVSQEGGAPIPVMWRSHGASGSPTSNHNATPTITPRKAMGTFPHNTANHPDTQPETRRRHKAFPLPSPRQILMCSNDYRFLGPEWWLRKKEEAEGGGGGSLKYSTTLGARPAFPGSQSLHPRRTRHELLRWHEGER
jgi:hypothetical protein